VLIGTIGAALVIRALVRRAELPAVTRYGIAGPFRILVLVPVAALFGGLFLVGQEIPTFDPVILANASALLGGLRSSRVDRRRVARDLP
jgi:hypothetical protein